ncbi:MAG: hypothetical protein AAF990_23155 [Bacteroidota bacterium]
MKMLAKFRKSGSFKVLSEKDQLRLKGGRGKSRSGGGSEPPPPPEGGGDDAGGL